MMPPKKSKAARATTEEDSVVTENEKPSKEMKKKEEAEEEERPEVNIFTQELVFGKRQRVAPSGQQKLLEWIDGHLEANEEVHLHPSDVYNVYLNSCINSNTNAFELLSFIKEVKQKFPKGSCFRADSPYYGSVKERKKRKSNDKKSKTSSPSNALKTRELLKGVFDDAGNPRKGLRFNIIKKLLMAKHPALQLDVRPVILKNALNRALYFGHVRLVKGIGCAGFYRWYVEGEAEEEEKEEKKSKKAAKKVEENGVSSDAKTDEDGEKSENKEETDGEEKKEDGKDKSGEKKKKKKKKKMKKKQTVSKQVVHSEPGKIIDTFQMAMTFMSDPKLASVGRVKKYLLDHYHQDVDMEKLRKTLQAGVDKGAWGQVSGSSAATGSYQLLLEDFDPLEDSDLSGKITNAIMASHEPKQCSFGLLKRYVAKYHPNFKVEERPNGIKKAVEKALDQGLIRRLTGIGCSGTFQLTKAFVPSPAVLAGNDTESDYEVATNYSDDDTAPQRGVKGFQLSDFQDAYKPRPTKRHGRKAARGQPTLPEVKGYTRGHPVKSAVRSKVKKQPKYHDSSDESDVEVVEKKKKKKKKSVTKNKVASPKKSSKKGNKDKSKKSTLLKKKKKTEPKSPVKRLYVESSDDEEEEEERAVMPVPTKAARKAVPPTPKHHSAKQKSATKRKADSSTERSSSRKSAISYAEVSDLEEEEDEPKKKKKKKKMKRKK